MTNKNLEMLAEELKGYKMMKKETEEEITRIEKLIKKEMEDRNVDSIIVGNYSLSYKVVARNRFDSEGFKKEYEDLYMQFYKPAPYMRFMLS